MGRHSDTGTAKAATVSQMPAGAPSSELSSEPADQSLPTGSDWSARPGTADETQLIRSAPSVADGPETDVIPSVGRSSSGRSVPAPAPLAARTALPSSLSAAPGPARPEQPTGRRSYSVGMWLSIVVFWLLAMPIGVLSAIIVAGRRATLCSKSSTGFGCSSTGSAVGVVLLVLVVAVVGTISVYAYDVRRAPRRWGSALGLGVGILAVVGFVAWLVVRTIQ